SGRARIRRRAPAVAGEPHGHRGYSLHRRALGDRRRRHRRGNLGDLDGRLHRPEHEDLRPDDGRDPVRAGAGRIGRRAGQPAVERRPLRALVRRHRQARRRADARQDVDQRTAARLTPMPKSERSPGDPQQETRRLAEALIACRSITPDDGGAMALIEERLARAGFVCERIDHAGVRNLWARRGDRGPLVCFAGHVDVVPPGPIDDWTSPPFEPTERDGYLYGRGASDMKGPLAAMITAAERLAAGDVPGSIALLVTSDEEGDAVDGTARVVEWLRARGESIDACIVGEPTSSGRFGDTIKNGRRASLSGELRVFGVQCHIAYPERGRNPILQALPVLNELASIRWDEGNTDFPPTQFQISNIHAGTGAA